MCARKKQNTTLRKKHELSVRLTVQYLRTSNATGAIHGFQGLQNNCIGCYIKTLPAKSWQCCITLSQLFLYGFNAFKNARFFFMKS